jgi:hypothetical protein
MISTLLREDRCAAEAERRDASERRVRRMRDSPASA